MTDARFDDDSPRLEFYPENEREEQFLRDFFGVYRYLRGPVMVHYGDIRVDGVETCGWVVQQFPAPTATAIAGTAEPVTVFALPEDDVPVAGIVD